MVMMMVSDKRIPYSGRGSPSLLGKQPDLPNVVSSSLKSKIQTAANKITFSVSIFGRYRQMASSCKWAPYMLVRAFSQFSNQTITHTGSFQCERFNLHTPRTWRTSCQSTRTPQTLKLSSSPFWAKPDSRRG